MLDEAPDDCLMGAGAWRSSRAHEMTSTTRRRAAAGAARRNESSVSSALVRVPKGWASSDSSIHRGSPTSPYPPNHSGRPSRGDIRSITYARIWAAASRRRQVRRLVRVVIRQVTCRAEATYRRGRRGFIVASEGRYPLPRNAHAHHRPFSRGASPNSPLRPPTSCKERTVERLARGRSELADDRPSVPGPMDDPRGRHTIHARHVATAALPSV